MITVKVKNSKEIDRALKIFKSRVNKSGIMKDLRDKKEYKKPSVLKREEKLKAIYNQKFKNNNNINLIDE